MVVSRLSSVARVCPSFGHLTSDRRPTTNDKGPLTNDHYHPQQSVLNPQAGQRQTACMRYMPAPQRSQRTLSSLAGGTILSGVIARGFSGVGSDIARIIAHA